MKARLTAALRNAVVGIGEFVGRQVSKKGNYFEIRLSASGAVPHPESAMAGERGVDITDVLIARRTVVTASGEVAVPVYQFDRLPIGADLTGPLIAETQHTSIYVPDGRRLRVDRQGDGVVEISR